jgi:hypothetical protein
MADLKVCVAAIFLHEKSSVFIFTGAFQMRLLDRRLGCCLDFSTELTAALKELKRQISRH